MWWSDEAIPPLQISTKQFIRPKKQLTPEEVIIIIFIVIIIGFSMYLILFVTGKEFEVVTNIQEILDTTCAYYLVVH